MHYYSMDLHQTKESSILKEKNTEVLTMKVVDFLASCQGINGQLAVYFEVAKIPLSITKLTYVANTNILYLQTSAQPAINLHSLCQQLGHLTPDSTLKFQTSQLEEYNIYGFKITTEKLLLA